MQDKLIGQVKRILIGGASGDMMCSRTDFHGKGLLLYMQAKGYSVGTGPAIGTFCEMGKNGLVMAAIEQKCDALGLIDSDMEFPASVMESLIKRNKPIIGVPYRTRQYPHEFAAKHLDDSKPTGKEKGLQEMKFVAAGMLLVKTHVLKKMGYPWFFNEYGWNPTEFVDDSANFCKKARYEGFEIWADWDLMPKVGHIAQVTIWGGGQDMSEVKSERIT